jgi:hypothetical protein
VPQPPTRRRPGRWTLSKSRAVEQRRKGCGCSSSNNSNSSSSSKTVLRRHLPGPASTRANLHPKLCKTRPSGGIGRRAGLHHRKMIGAAKSSARKGVWVRVPPWPIGREWGPLPHSFHDSISGTERQDTGASGGCQPPGCSWRAGGVNPPVAQPGGSHPPLAPLTPPARPVVLPGGSHPPLASPPRHSPQRKLSFLFAASVYNNGLPVVEEVPCGECTHGIVDRVR